MWQRRKEEVRQVVALVAFYLVCTKGPNRKSKKQSPRKKKQKLGIKSDFCQNDRREGGCSIKVIKSRSEPAQRAEL
jgi:hypothetical protein